MTWNIRLTEIADLLNAELHGNDAIMTGSKIDSRKIEAGDLFIALPGENTDGHDYIDQAYKAGACGALVNRYIPSELPQIVVKNVISAYGQIARLCREKSQARIIAVTGSNGKTTLKEMIASILGQCGKVLATAGNLNNELGVPLTLTRLNENYDFAVIEMGANHAGEIATLVAMAEPDVAVINNVGAAHLEGFGSLQGIAEAKGEIFAGLKAEGIGVINADMPYVDLWKHILGARQSLTFGLQQPADIAALDLQPAITGSHFMVRLEGVCHFIFLPLPGIHNVSNALAAIAVCSALKIAPEAIVKGLASIKSVPHRLQLRQAVNNALVIDDTYNANPGSFRQALKTLMQFPGEHWLVLGDFGELGPESTSIHQQLGRDARTAGVNRLFTVGQQSKLASAAFGDNARHFNDKAELEAELKRILTKDVACLIKGSRFMKLDQLADALAVGGEA
ncbi:MULTISPECIES: UDP-N-acetylmuramoyl-tripeptide--D-alanyl-D-alanine ligase [unclassified Methylophaga]|jgi:UDP-N-acetylmuramoyl-tripeptide--D-alanyl-D-alanine ligase|uniref:UDP-N-acetylmuramoyl-tripeptide--D-alanyl-D- alanine ligase n=1 Tax=unclassified Methylophaga TaxID=2629249 RepID=UPI000C971749|nr:MULTISPECIES: UDP-N-acetylmuramoyl-tripeptide--D-alanyl-D-alanine ligase [unclassified Methylophaga]MAY17980.1 UDP-N-acetylmuramoyl-tripeptide--D-alanyl-D-alanine ligase [Methylophaga sp.]MBN47190.1 UDP-N-acetylmuramoyl-tripeptide--D-alanyl-D-alanine ligase [Methylophaga sp.]HCD04576.1 UDP-N-acetylmuramoyl-tripeptide--D-alanyl-D-alanine ligase [Methylophaga sp.]|tara:strand:- start:9858 stop:11213 length:1356 start_codon:yes stop_codon:yes gene_type:complete